MKKLRLFLISIFYRRLLLSKDYLAIKVLVANYYQIPEIRISPITNISPDCIKAIKMQIFFKTDKVLYTDKLKKFTVLSIAKSLK